MNWLYWLLFYHGCGPCPRPYTPVLGLLSTDQGVRGKPATDQPLSRDISWQVLLPEPCQFLYRARVAEITIPEVVFRLSLDGFKKNWIVEGLECTEAVLAWRTACIPMRKRRNAFCMYGVSYWEAAEWRTSICRAWRCYKCWLLCQTFYWFQLAHNRT